MEAVKLGSATVGLKNQTHAALIALKRASSELSAYQKKIIPIDKHMGISISGLTADARILRHINYINWLLQLFSLINNRILLTAVTCVLSA